MNKTVLIADDDADIVDLLRRRCERLRFAVHSADDATTALAKIEEILPDVVILDVDMPNGNGLSVREMMSDHEKLKDVPVIMLTASASEETVRRCHERCSYYVLKCPDVWSRVEPILRELFGCDENQNLPERKAVDLSPEHDVPGPVELMDTVFAILGVEEGDSLLSEAEHASKWSDQPWVLSIEDDDDVALALRMRLEDAGIHVIRATAGMEGYRRAFLDAPRAIILDYELPRGNGDYVLRRLNESTATSNIPVIVLTGRREAMIERQMRSLGAREFLTKPLDWKRLFAALEMHLDQPVESARVS